VAAELAVDVELDAPPAVVEVGWAFVSFLLAVFGLPIASSMSASWCISNSWLSNSYLPRLAGKSLEWAQFVTSSQTNFASRYPGVLKGRYSNFSDM
jgi:hypothetical protein